MTQGETIRQAEHGQLPCLHIGYAKAASTTLQAHFFGGHPGLLNVGRPDPEPLVLESIRAALAAADTAARGKVGFDDAKYRAVWQQQLARAARSGKVVAFSHERLTNPSFYRGPSDTTLPEMLRAMIGPCRIIIMVRDQMRLLESYYLHKCKISAYRPPGQWLAENSDELLPMLRYDALARSYGSVFGADNVGVFLFEELRDDPAAFARRLCRFVGVDEEAGVALLQGKRENVRRSSRLLWYAAIRSRILPQAHFSAMLPDAVTAWWKRFLQGGGKAEVRFAAEWTRKLETLYRDSNAALVAQHALPLERFGYCI